MIAHNGDRLEKDLYEVLLFYLDIERSIDNNLTLL